RIDHEKLINRGYVHCSAFISEADAEAEFRRKNPKVKETRIVKYVSGRYQRAWVKNVVAIGNSGGFVEPLESTGLGAICVESLWLSAGLAEMESEVRPTVKKLFNRRVGRNWDAIRGFLAIHYKFNTRLNTPFWIECQQKADLAGATEIVEYFQENGPSIQWWISLLDADDQFTSEGYLALLVGQRVPYRILTPPSQEQRAIWERIRKSFRDAAARGFTVEEALRTVKSPDFKWPELWAKVLPGAPVRTS
ncbi:MAG TPA: tryptophan 7-halogenase, partial [Tepidisphaeraceae bacterium]|nr:tryptophan 7-halogenase [Tepidisphaeraceae bacterium]